MDARERSVVLAAFVAPAVLAALVVALFWLVRDLPPNWGCGDSPPPGQDARLDAYRSGFEALHAVVALAAAAAVLALSRLRRARAGHGGVGTWTVVGLVAAVVTAVPGSWFVGLALAEAADALGSPRVPAVLAIAGLVAVAGALGARARSAPAGALGAHARPAPAETREVREDSAPDRPPLRAAAAVAWTVLLLTPGHALVVRLQGDGPVFC